MHVYVYKTNFSGRNIFRYVVKIEIDNMKKYDPF